MSKKQNPEQDVKVVDAASSSAELGKRRRRKIGALSVVSTIIVILAVIVVNYFVDYIADRYVLEIDMTSNSEYEISDETVQLLQTLDEPITITVLCDETDYESDSDLARLPKVLQRYQQLSDGEVTVKYINAVTNPGIFEQYDKLGDLSTGDIIVESEKRYKSMSPYDLLEYTSSSSSSSSTSSDDESSYVTGLRAEQRLTSAILYVTANKVPKAAYTTGHQETTDLEEFESLLASGNYEVSKVNLMTDEIESDIDMLIISQPLADFTSDEIDKLDVFMNDGGKLVVTYASNTPELPNLDEYFTEWGVEYGDSMIYDTEQCYAGYNAYILPNMETLDGLTDNIGSGYTIIPGARPINTLWENDNWRVTQPLLTTTASSYAKDLSAESDGYEQTADDETGPFNVGVLAYQTNMHNLDSTYSYILFLNAGFISDSVLESTSFLNSDYITAALNFMSDDSETVVIPSKDLTTESLVVTGAAKRVLFYLLIFVIPGVCLVSGFVVWAKRRHK